MTPLRVFALHCAIVGCARAVVPSRASAPSPIARVEDARSDVAPGPSTTTVSSRVTSSPAWVRISDGLAYRRAHALGEEGASLEWLVVRIDLSRATPAALRVRDARLLALAQDPRVLFAVDAGFFELDGYEPSGLLVSAGEQLHGLGARGGSGVLIVRGGAAEVLEAAAPLPREPRIDLAVQCGPRLIERDGSVGIHRDDGQRYARTAACLRDRGRTLDIVLTWSSANPMRGPGLYTFARMLAQPSPVGDREGCEMALNLDGGPSTGVYVRGAPEATHAPLGPVPWAIVVNE